MTEDRQDHTDRREADRRDDDPQQALPEDARVREGDLEPFSALRYIARLFKFLAVLLILLLLAEVTLGLVEAGTSALAGILVDATRLLVFAAFLWAGGDIALMLVETNHDLRATRILVGRLTHEVEELRQTMRGATGGGAETGGASGPETGSGSHGPRRGRGPG